MKKPDFPANGTLIVFAKTLDTSVKTRIALTEGQTAARNIYRELLTATSTAIETIPYHVAFTGSDQPGELSDHFKNAVSFYSQTGNNLGERMKNACLYCLQRGYLFAILIGCDCPERPAEDIILAANYLSSGTDVVLGPVEDGGYHLAGVNAQGLKIFDATQWSMPSLMNETLQITQQFDLKTMLLAPRNDIDTIGDYRRWRARIH